MASSQCPDENILSAVVQYNARYDVHQYTSVYILIVGVDLV